MEKKKREPIFTKDFLLIFLAGGLVRVCYQMQITIAPLYGNHLGFSAASIGMLTAVSTVASLILRPLLGGMLDRHGRRIIVLIGTLLFAVATGLCGWTGGLAALMALRIVQGLGFSAHTTAVNTLATDVLPESRMTEGIGYMGLTGSISMAVSPAVALLLIGGGNYGGGYGIACAAGLLAVVALLFVDRRVGLPIVAEAEETQDSQHYTGWQRFWEKNAINPSIVMLILSWCYAALSTFLATYALGKGFSAVQVSLYFTVNAAAMAAARLLGGRVAQKIGMNRTMFFASMLSIAAFLLIAVANQPYLLWLAAALHGLGYGTMYPINNALAVTSAPKERRGTAMSTFLTAMDLGAGFGAGIWGLAIDWVGIHWLYYMCAVLSLMAYVAYRVLVMAPTKKSIGGIRHEI